MPDASIIAINKRARTDYQILDTFEAGLQLTGPEVKSCKKGQVNLKGSYAAISAGSIPYLIGCHISPYKPASQVQQNYDPTRSRRLLLRKKQIAMLIGKLKEKQYTLVPLAITNKRGLIKVDLGLARGKKQYEKRETIKRREVDREILRRVKR